MKVAVEVCDACDLMPKDGHGSSSPFVEVDFDGQRQRTTTKPKELNPYWNETLVFNVSDPTGLVDRAIDVSVYHDRTKHSFPGDQHNAAAGHHRNFLGRVRILGSSVAPSATDVPLNRFPLEKRGLFSHISGEIALRVYAVHDGFAHQSPPPIASGEAMPQAETIFDKPARTKTSPHPTEHQEPRSAFFSVGKMEHERPISVNAGPPPGGASAMRMQSAAGPPPVMVAGFPRQPPSEFGLVETRPPLAGRLGYRGGDKIASTYDLVEQMHFLYVNVVKGRDLPAMDLTGSLDPYVEVKLGNYKGVTRHLEKNQNPVWRQVFAFSKERLQADRLEVVVKDKDVITKDDFVGKLTFDVSECPVRVPPDSPLASQWYRLEDKKGEKVAKGEIMLSVWMGTQADEAFPDAWHSDAHSVTMEGLAQTRSKVYFSPKLCYLRIHVIEAQDLVPYDKSRPPDMFVKIQIGNQLRRTRPVPAARSVNPRWDEELMFVAAEPFDEPLVVTVEDHVAPGKDEPLGRVVLPVAAVAPMRGEHVRLPDARWFNLGRPTTSAETAMNRFSSKIHLRLSLDAAYHVLDESTHYSSDLQPSSKHLRKPAIGVLELGVLSARNLAPVKAREGRLTDAYCVSKYGHKWVRTRTILNSLAPRWNEQYTWEVFDHCTVVTIAVFDNSHVGSGNREDARDQHIGKIRIRLSTLETDRVYTHYHPLLVLQNSGLKKTGELHLAIRFTCTAWVNMVALYGKPLLPKMHYVQQIPVLQLDYLRHQATQIVAARLARSEPPLRREAVEYMLDVDSHMWSLRRSKANFNRITSLLSCFAAVARWLDGVRNWRNPVATVLVHVLFLILVCYPELILPTGFLYLFMIGVWNYRFRPRHPPHMDTKLSHAELAHPDELDEEFDTFPTSKSSEMVRLRYDRLRSVAGRVQTVVGDLATQGERAAALLSWRDPRATWVFVFVSLACAVMLYVTPFQVLAVAAGLYLLRHPRFRSRMPSVPFNYYRRLPPKSDMLL